MLIRHTDLVFNGKLTLRKQTTEIIIHCTATIEGKPYSVEQIHRQHLAQGYSGIGYNFVIDLDGNIWEGRPEDKVGAHCKNHNSKSIGICYVGGLDKNKKPKDTRTEKQKQAMLELCMYLMAKYTQATVHGHCEFANKSCPCFNAQEWWSEQMLTNVNINQD